MYLQCSEISMIGYMLFAKMKETYLTINRLFMDLWGDNIHSCNECKNDLKQWKEDEKDIFTIDMIQASTCIL